MHYTEEQRRIVARLHLRGYTVEEIQAYLAGAAGRGISEYRKCERAYLAGYDARELRAEERSMSGLKVA